MTFFTITPTILLKTGSHVIIKRMVRKGFTLIELMVTAVILSVLMAILMPALHAARQQARAIECSSSIKELLLAMTVYGTDNKTLPYGFYDDRNIGPPQGGYAGNKQFDRTGWWWFNYLDVYFDKNRDRNTLQCPSKCLNNPIFEDYVTCGNYGINQSICKAVPGRGFRAEFEGVPLSIGSIKSPQRTLLIVDSGYTLINWWHATQEPPSQLRSKFIEDTSYIPGLNVNTDREFWPGQETDAFRGRHPRKTVNIGFVDGHVDRRKADDLLVEKLGDQYKNLSPLWKPK